MAQETSLHIYVIVGEESGDQLGAELVKVLRERFGSGLKLSGVGGERLAAQGVNSLFPLEDISVMGISAVLERLPLIIKRVYQTVDDVEKKQPDALVIIDSPDFTLNVAKRVRKRCEHLPIIDYVSPSVWAWRPGRAKKMAAFVDQLLALLPFEPEAHRRLGGPKTDYVGHPLIERLDVLRPQNGERAALGAGQDTLLVLPGSRGSEVKRLMAPFGETVRLVKEKRPDLNIQLVGVPHQLERIKGEMAKWAEPVEIVSSIDEKFTSFRRAHVALAASGTVSLELAIAGVPMVVAYKLDWFFRRLKQLNRFIKLAQVDSIVLPNIILKRNVIPEFIEEEADPHLMANNILRLLEGGDERLQQVQAFAQLDEVMQLPEGESQAGKAADLIIETINRVR
ncbi:lipid-A-disaccharide synthase [Polycladidibacter stylochi]|uniref:lipid-A-disaccharide synthase n=1 Tax=Polycladidibacter stylochi TaxID=1807766 RepID=UPI00082BC124|nr:lipid-A-disaccharide synthase [Pseudovibrio stylochi]